MHYTRCAECPGTNKCLPPDGPEDAPILFVGEAPGHNEERKGKVFVGSSGEELDYHYLPLAGLRRDRIRITNAIACLPTTSAGKLQSSRKKDLSLLQSCAAKRLYPEIETTGQYRLLVPLGAFACRAICPDIDLDLQHGIPCETAWGIPAFPMFHPARGIHEPKKMLQIRTDWMRLKRYLRGELVLPHDDSEPDYQEVTDAAEFQELQADLPIALDTETDKAHRPFCLTYSQEPSRGRLVRADSPALLQAFQRSLLDWKGPVLVHNWLFDASVLDEMGIHIHHRRVVDTMARVFQLGNLPQGLKALAYRECGMTMQSFEDVVAPHSAAAILHYLRIAQTYEWAKPDEELVQDEKTGLWKLYKPQGMSTKLKRFFTDVDKNPEKDIFQAWENWGKKTPLQRDAIEAQCGPYPGMCITHAPFAQVLYYACRDVDALIRLWPVLQQMGRQVRRRPQDKWRAA